MMRNRMTSILAVGGFVLAMVQWMRMRSRPRGMQRMTNWASDMMSNMRR